MESTGLGRHAWRTQWEVMALRTAPHRSGGAQALRGQPHVTAHRRGQGALAGKATFLGDAYQRQIALTQHSRSAVETGLEQVLMRGQADTVLEQRMKVAGAQAHLLSQFGDTDPPGQMFGYVVVQALQIQRPLRL